MLACMTKTAKYQILSVRLGRDVGVVISEGRARGESYAALASRLSQESGIPVSFETIRLWHESIMEGGTK